MTKFRIALVVIAVSLGGSVANAEPSAGIATLASPAQQAKVSGEAGVWRCEGTSCTGLADTRVGIAVAACTMVANANGRVTNFTAGGTGFGETELKRCNRHVK